jgi:phosphoenolpyruvate carboxylase
LHFFNETLFSGAVEAWRDLQDALARHYPEDGIEAPAVLRFASWIGGDRDGNPNVTTAVTYRTLLKMRDNALRHYVGELDRLISMLSISDRITPAPEAFRHQLDALLARTGQREAIERRNSARTVSPVPVCDADAAARQHGRYVRWGAALSLAGRHDCRPQGA